MPADLQIVLDARHVLLPRLREVLKDRDARNHLIPLLVAHAGLPATTSIIVTRVVQSLREFARGYEGNADYQAACWYLAEDLIAALVPEGPARTEALGKYKQVLLANS